MLWKIQFHDILLEFCVFNNDVKIYHVIYLWFVCFSLPFANDGNLDWTGVKKGRYRQMWRIFRGKCTRLYYWQQVDEFERSIIGITHVYILDNLDAGRIFCCVTEHRKKKKTKLDWGGLWKNWAISFKSSRRKCQVLLNIMVLGMLLNKVIVSDQNKWKSIY